MLAAPKMTSVRSSLNAGAAAVAAHYDVFWAVAVFGLMVPWALFCATSYIDSSWRVKTVISSPPSPQPPMRLRPSPRVHFVMHAGEKRTDLVWGATHQRQDDVFTCRSMESLCKSR